MLAMVATAVKVCVPIGPMDLRKSINGQSLLWEMNEQIR
jgi:hypothetical protein